MIIQAWECDNCGMLTRAESEKEPPEGWLRIFWHKGGLATEVNQVVCSGRCASKSFLAADGITTNGHKPKAKVSRAKKWVPPITIDGVHVCPECGRQYDYPQHLGMHRKRQHGVESERDRLNRKG